MKLSDVLGESFFSKALIRKNGIARVGKCTLTAGQHKRNDQAHLQNRDADR